MAVKLEKWLIARKKHRLSAKHVQMCLEIGMHPDKLEKIDNCKQEPWKAPLPRFIEDIYFKRFKREEPLSIKSIEELIREGKEKEEKRKKEKKREAKLREESPPTAVYDQSVPLAATSIPRKKKASLPVEPAIKPKLESGDSHETILRKEAFLFDLAFDSIAKEEAALSELGFVLKKIHPRYKPRRYGCKALGAIYEKLGKYELLPDPATGITGIVKKK